MKEILLALCLVLAGTEGAGGGWWNKEPRLEMPVSSGTVFAVEGKADGAEAAGAGEEKAAGAGEEKAAGAGEEKAAGAEAENGGGAGAEKVAGTGAETAMETNTEAVSGPEISAPSAVLMEASTGQIIYESRQMNREVRPALQRL